MSSAVLQQRAIKSSTLATNAIKVKSSACFIAILPLPSLHMSSSALSLPPYLAGSDTSHSDTGSWCSSVSSLRY